MTIADCQSLNCQMPIPIADLSVVGAAKMGIRQLAIGNRGIA
jgi:hypothetical protein